MEICFQKLCVCVIFKKNTCCAFSSLIFFLTTGRHALKNPTNATTKKAKKVGKPGACWAISSRLALGDGWGSWASGHRVLPEGPGDNAL